MEINRLLEDEDDEIEATPYEIVQPSDSEIDDSDEDLTWEPENEPSISDRLQEDIRKTLQQIQELEKKGTSLDLALPRKLIKLLKSIIWETLLKRKQERRMILMTRY